MGLVWMDLRAALRLAPRQALGLALVVGIAGGLVLAAAAGARRTGNSYDRFLDEYRRADVFLPNPDFGPGWDGIVLDPADVEQHPDVEEVGVGRVAISEWGASFAAADERFGTAVPAWKIVEGRTYDPGRVDEAVVFWAYAQRSGLGVGDRIRYPGDAPPDADPSCANIGEGPQIELTIVGVVTAPGPFFAPPLDELWSLGLTPTLAARLPSLAEETGCAFLAFPPTPGAMWVSVKPGRLEGMLAELEDAGDGAFLISEVLATTDERNAASIGFQAVALWILAFVAGIVALLVVGQAIARQVRMGADDQGALRALGATRGQLTGASVAKVMVPGLIGAMLAIAIAFLLSPIAPLGTARLAEPRTGFAFDSDALLLGACAIASLLLCVALPVALSATGRRASTIGRSGGPSGIAATGRVLGLGATGVVGLQLAFESGRGRSSVPVRSAIAAISIGTALVVAALVFGAGVAHLVSTPESYGAHVDAWIHNDPEGFAFEEHLEAIREDPDIEGAALGSPGSTAQLDGIAVEAISYEPVMGPVSSTILSGRQISATDEILLGSRTASDLGKSVGDDVSVRVSSSGSPSERTMAVVGIAVIPPFDRSGLGAGAIVSLAGMQAMFPDLPSVADGLFVRVREGADVEHVVARLKKRTGNEDLQHFGFSPPSEILNFGRVDRLPLVLAAMITLIGVATFAHIFTSAVRRRRSDLAVLKVLGFERGQIRRAIAWQATATSVATLFIGLPVGIVIGRWFWIVFSHQLGLVPAPIVPAVSVALVVPAAIVIANAVALFPARSAARTQPATTLMVE